MGFTQLRLKVLVYALEPLCFVFSLIYMHLSMRQILKELGQINSTSSFQQTTFLVFVHMVIQELHLIVADCRWGNFKDISDGLLQLVDIQGPRVVLVAFGEELLK